MSGCSTVFAEQAKASRKVFHKEDPAQHAFRALLSLLDDNELVSLENEIDFYARSGLVSPMMDQLLNDADRPLHEVA